MELKRAILFAKDIDRMSAFYREKLGLRRIDDGSTPGWAELAAGEARLALHAIPAAIAAGIDLGDPCGVSMLEVTPWGACDGIDPEGNVFQLVNP